MEDKTIKGLEGRISRLEKAVFGDSKKPKPEKKAGDFKGATGGVRYLITKKFFNGKQTLAEIRSALGKDGYHYSAQAVQMAISRLSKKRGPLTALKEGGKKVYVDRK